MDLSDINNPTIIKLVQTAVVLAIGLGIFFGLKGRILQFAKKANLPRLAMTPVRVSLRYAVLVLTGVMALGIWGYNTASIVTAIGAVIGLVAIGFVAVWSVLSNVLCTVVLIALKPFSVGDDVELVSAGVKGRVVDLSVIYTTLEVAEGETVLIPNNLFFQGAIRRRVGKHTRGLDQQLDAEQFNPGKNG